MGTNWRICASFANENSASGTINFPLLSNQDSKSSIILSLQLPLGHWDSSLLSNLRDKVVEAGLGVVFLPGGIISKLDIPLTLQDILEKIDLPAKTHQARAVDNHHKLTNLQSFTKLSREVMQEITLNQEEISVRVHSSLPAVKLVHGRSCQYTVLAVTENMATIKCGSLPDIKIAEAGTVCAGDLCLYNDSNINHRAVVKDISEEHAEVWLVDKGLEVICDPTELFAITTELCSKPPTVVCVDHVGKHSLEVGEATGTMLVVDKKLVMSLN